MQPHVVLWKRSPVLFTASERFFLAQTIFNVYDCGYKLDPPWNNRHYQQDANIMVYGLQTSVPE